MQPRAQKSTLGTRSLNRCLTVCRPLIPGPPESTRGKSRVAIFHKYVPSVGPQIPNSTYTQSTLLTRIGCRILDPPQEIPKRSIPAIDKVSDQPSIHYWVLTAGETLMLAGILIVVLIGVLMRAGVLANTLGLAATLAGNLMLARATTEISMPTSTQVSVPASTLISEEIEISGGAPIPDGTQTLVAEHRLDQGNDTRDRRGGYRKNRRKRSRIRDDRTMKWYENSGWLPE